jgi:hypothetical protein
MSPYCSIVDVTETYAILLARPKKSPMRSFGATRSLQNRICSAASAFVTNAIDQASRTNPCFMSTSYRSHTARILPAPSAMILVVYAPIVRTACSSILIFRADRPDFCNRCRKRVSIKERLIRNRGHDTCSPHLYEKSYSHEILVCQTFEEFRCL